MKNHKTDDINNINYKRIFIIVLIFMISISAVITAAYIFSELNIGIPCPFYFLTGLYCPGCGGTRAVEALLNLDFIQALRYNSFIFLAVPFILYYLICLSWAFVRGERYEAGKKFSVILIVLCAVGIVYGVIRNLPQFSFLAPTEL